MLGFCKRCSIYTTFTILLIVLIVNVYSYLQFKQQIQSYNIKTKLQAIEIWNQYVEDKGYDKNYPTKSIMRVKFENGKWKVYNFRQRHISHKYLHSHFPLDVYIDANTGECVEGNDTEYY